MSEKKDLPTTPFVRRRNSQDSSPFPVPNRKLPEVRTSGRKNVSVSRQHMRANSLSTVTRNPNFNIGKKKMPPSPGHPRGGKKVVRSNPTKRRGDRSHVERDIRRRKDGPKVSRTPKLPSLPKDPRIGCEKLPRKHVPQEKHNKQINVKSIWGGMKKLGQNVGRNINKTAHDPKTKESTKEFFTDLFGGVKNVASVTRDVTVDVMKETTKQANKTYKTKFVQNTIREVDKGINEIEKGVGKGMKESKKAAKRGLKKTVNTSMNVVEKVVHETKKQHVNLKNKKFEKEDLFLPQYDENNTSEKKIFINVCTWNVNECSSIDPEDLSEWLQLEETPEIIVIGLQEVDMSAKALIKGSLKAGGTNKKDRWEKILELGVLSNSKGIRYIELESKQLVGIYCVVYVRHDQIQYVRDMRSQKLACGALGALGNKGGVAIRFQYHFSTLCFVNAHFEAHRQHVDKRNQHFKTLEHGFNFEGDPRRYNCANHDVLIWLGDLNYRIDMKYDLTLSRISEYDLSFLLLHDQLTKEKIKGSCFFGYKEGKINFLPTYKFDIGTNDYDTSEKKRIPSYTDRILWKMKSVNTKCLNYQSFEKYDTSDHKPVSACFEVKLMVPKVPFKKLPSNPESDPNMMKKPLPGPNFSEKMIIHHDEEKPIVQHHRLDERERERAPDPPTKTRNEHSSSSPLVPSARTRPSRGRPEKGGRPDRGGRPGRTGGRPGRRRGKGQRGRPGRGQGRSRGSRGNRSRGDSRGRSRTRGRHLRGRSRIRVRGRGKGRPVQQKFNNNNRIGVSHEEPIPRTVKVSGRGGIIPSETLRDRGRSDVGNRPPPIRRRGKNEIHRSKNGDRNVSITDIFKM